MPKARKTDYPGPDAYKRVEYNEQTFLSAYGEGKSQADALLEQVEGPKEELNAYSEKRLQDLEAAVNALSKTVHDVAVKEQKILKDPLLSDLGRSQEREKLISEAADKIMQNLEPLKRIRGEVNQTINTIELRKPEQHDPYLSKEIRDGLRRMDHSDRMKIYLENCQNPTEDGLPFFEAVERQIPGLPNLIDPDIRKQGRWTRAMAENPVADSKLKLAKIAANQTYVAATRAFKALTDGGLKDAHKHQAGLEEHREETQEFFNQEI